ncbi:MAG: sirohydrochlorin cobaltochelatase [Clostridiales Family XIII bacterium]|nr:sirohydrochlorin cobaltochelatase [Anaerovorax odorimutans]MCI7301744.1 sirohydrochlorin cobaltochelatase [Clostridia bacterium]MDY3012255.1 sirohydrochlorin cobaltochelatase [Clostridiales Family XIII bacterium]
MTKKEAILAVSFGTSHQETRKKTIEAIEHRFREEFPGHEVRRAFTSGMIMNVLKKRDQIHVDNVSEALERLKKDRFDRVVVQPTHVINGEEYEKMTAQVQPWIDRFASIVVGRPLLTESDDYQAVCSAVLKQFPKLKEEEALVLMGHGTEHSADAAYAAMAYRFRAMGHNNVFVGTVEGYPALENLLPLVKEYGPKKVILLPLMVVAGDHARSDMAGEDEASWKSIFEKEGYEVMCILKGLGEFAEIQDIYVEHARQAMENDHGTLCGKRK